jgi:hypothetical protein
MPTETKTSLWPIDVSSLDKGSVIPQRELETIVRYKVNHPKYQMAIMHLILWIDRQLEADGRVLVVCQHKGDLRVLTDAEAAVYTARQQRKARRTLVKNHTKGMHVDVTQLDDVQRREHDRNLHLNAAYIAGGETNRRKAIKMLAAPRKTPGALKK